jgi:hypothetical protein
MRPAQALLMLAMLAAAPVRAESSALLACHDYGCKSQTVVRIGDQDWRRLGQLFEPTAADAAAERQQIARAIALMEQIAAPQISPQADLGENFDGNGLPGQMDCIDESRNTTAYLQLLEQRSLLRHHRVGERAYRAPWIFDQHWTATIRAEDGSDWAIDSWFLDSGRQPYVQALPAWLDNDDLPYNPDAES